MVKVGVELPDDKIYGVDLSRPELGNPGVGGSEYLFALLASELYKNGIDVTIYHYSDNILPSSSSKVLVTDSIDMLKKAQNDEISILIHQVGKSNEWYRTLESLNVFSVAWAHVYLDYYELELLRKCKNVKRVVFVGKEEYDSYIDDDIITKSVYIYNMIPTKIPAQERNHNGRTVTYVGSLVPAKGFHELAQIWPSVVKEVPDAELNVIGNGKVYNRSAKLGRFGIAQEDYENLFMQYLLDENGRILPSVHFLGIVGAEKSEIFKKTTVGVVNPTALTETFCMSAVEMEYAYIPVVSRGKWGLLDTVNNKCSGFLFKTKSEFTKQIIELLKNARLNYQMGKNAHDFVTERFSVDAVIPSWIDLIIDIDQGKPVQFYKARCNWQNDYKWIKQGIRFARFTLGFEFLPSFYDIKHTIKIKLRK